MSKFIQNFRMFTESMDYSSPKIYGGNKNMDAFVRQFFGTILEYYAYDESLPEAERQVFQDTIVSDISNLENGILALDIFKDIVSDMPIDEAEDAGSELALYILEIENDLSERYPSIAELAPPLINMEIAVNDEGKVHCAPPVYPSL